MTESLSSSDPDYVAEMAYMLNPKVEYSLTGNGSLSGQQVSLDANGDCIITAKITLSKKDKSYLNQNFENGMYVEGFICLKTEDGTDLNIPLLAFLEIGL